jgi:hypothetical protein
MDFFVLVWEPVLLSEITASGGPLFSVQPESSAKTDRTVMKITEVRGEGIFKIRLKDSFIN